MVSQRTLLQLDLLISYNQPTRPNDTRGMLVDIDEIPSRDEIARRVR